MIYKGANCSSSSQFPTEQLSLWSRPRRGHYWIAGEARNFSETPGDGGSGGRAYCRSGQTNSRAHEARECLLDPRLALLGRAGQAPRLATQRRASEFQTEMAPSRHLGGAGETDAEEAPGANNSTKTRPPSRGEEDGDAVEKSVSGFSGGWCPQRVVDLKARPAGTPLPIGAAILTLISRSIQMPFLHFRWYRFRLRSSLRRGSFLSRAISSAWPRISSR